MRLSGSPRARQRTYNPIHKARHDSKEETHRKSTHEHAGYCFDWGQDTPHWRYDKITAALGRVAANREVESQTPTGKARPAIECRPDQNLREVQSDHQRGDPNYECSGVYQAEPLRVGKVREAPIDERGHTSALNPQAERYQNGCGDCRSNEFHGCEFTSSDAKS